MEYDFFEFLCWGHQPHPSRHRCVTQTRPSPQNKLGIYGSKRCLGYATQIRFCTTSWDGGFANHHGCSTPLLNVFFFTRSKCAGISADMDTSESSLMGNFHKSQFTLRSSTLSSPSLGDPGSASSYDRLVLDVPHHSEYTNNVRSVSQQHSHTRSMGYTNCRSHWRLERMG
jgi:hypothetical protein